MNNSWRRCRVLEELWEEIPITDVFSFRSFIPSSLSEWFGWEIGFEIRGNYVWVIHQV